MKRVLIVCDGCGDTSKTDEYVRRMAVAFGVSTGVVHEALWDGMEINGVPIEISGAHVERDESAEPDDGAA